MNTALQPTKLLAFDGRIAGQGRVESVDILRGIVMILMALDHVRDYFGQPGVSPTNLAETTIPLFFTRWVTHFCAPTFFLLMGTGAYLALARRSKSQLSGFLFTRGLWLIFLEVTLFRCLGWQFNFDYHVTLLMILWALGCTMIALSALVYLPAPVVTAFGIVMIAGHNLFDGIRSSSPLWSILHRPNLLVPGPPHALWTLYPLVPWIGVTAAGYGLGQIYSWDSDRRRHFLLSWGIRMCVAFLVLRAANVYGDPSRWSMQKSVAFTVLSFINTTKYPPSLLFLLMTLGPAMIALSLLDAQTPRLLRPALVFGRVPMFYYLLHVPLIHLLATGVCFFRYGHVHWMFESPDLGHFPISPPPGWGFSLPIIYLVWIFVVLVLYPVCHWFAGYKRRYSYVWLSYF
jgi:uncharacterized membrane protein